MKGIEMFKVEGGLTSEVSSLCYNSKNCHENSLFVAISGLKSDGHDYIPEAIARGARFIVHEKEFSWGQILNLSPTVTAIKVADSRRALGMLAKNFYRHPSSHLLLIGVTGTNGKTTVTYLLEAIFRAAGFSVGVLGTVNYRFKGKVLAASNTTPESFEMQRILREMVNDGVTHAVVEVSSHAVDLKRADDCAFDLGIFTNLSPEHLDYHKTMENYFQAKKRFFEEVLPAGGKEHRMIVNIDDPWGQRLLKEVAMASLTFGMENECDVTVEEFNLSLEGIKATIRTDEAVFTVSSPLLGRFNLYNILAATAGAVSLHIPERCIRSGIESFKNVPGRLEAIGKSGQPRVFVDYAHTSDALKKVLENLSELKKGKIITVFGCGGDRDRGKRPLMGEVATTFSDLAVLTSDNPRTEDPLVIIREIEMGIHADSIRRYLPDDLDKDIPEKGYLVIPDRRTAIEKAISLAGNSDIILIAGKGHEDYQVIGDQRFPFDDREVVREVINRLWTDQHRMENSKSPLAPLSQRGDGGIFRNPRFPILAGHEILKATGGTLIRGSADRMFHGVSTDSRDMSEGNLFVPLKGERFDGHDFLGAAVRGGAVGLLVQRDAVDNADNEEFKDIAVIRVDDTLRALGDIAHLWRKRFHAPVIAITGSSGKTTTKEMTAHIAGLTRKVIKTEGNFNNLIGLPLTIFQINDQHEVVILEMGTNTPGEIGRLTRIAAPDIGLITNIGPAHLDGLGSLDAIREEKGDLFQNMAGEGIAIINRDDGEVGVLDGRWQGRRITFGMSRDADVSAGNIITRREQGVIFTLKIGGIGQEITMATVGLHNIYNALAAAAVCHVLGMEHHIICRGLTTFKPLSGRMEVHRLRNGAFLIDDTYNANPASVREALKTLKDLKEGHESTVIMADMLELGERVEEMHEGIGSLMAQTGVGAIFLRGRFSWAVAEGAIRGGMPINRILLPEISEEIVTRLKSSLKKGDWVLVKGSRKMRMEEVVQEIIRVFGLQPNTSGR